jgi:N-acetyltransferase
MTEASLLHFGDLHLEGAHVVLRALRPDDANALAFAAAESREHYRYNPVPDGLAEAQAYIARALAQRVAGERHPFAIVWRGRIVGTTSYSDYQPWAWPPAGAALQRHSAPDAVEVGYTWLAASAQRTGCNTEAKLLLIRHAFEVWRVHRVCLRTDQRNARSRAAIERLGAQYEGILRSHRPGADGTVRSSAYYSLLPEEWPAARARLEARLAAHRG